MALAVLDHVWNVDDSDACSLTAPGSPDHYYAANNEELFVQSSALEH
jgi:hypothetical protein